MYKITDSVLSNNAPSYIGVGIHEVELSEIVLDKSKNNKIFFAYYYTNSDGQKLSKTEWEVNLPANFDSLPEEKKKGYDIVMEQQMKRILKVATLYVPEDEFKDKSFNTFSDFCGFVKQKIEGKTKGVKLRIKATYDKNGWVTTPTYTYESMPWIERIDQVAKEDSKIQIIEGRDLVVRPKQANEQREKNPLLDGNANASATTTKSDLPF